MPAFSNHEGIIPKPAAELKMGFTERLRSSNAQSPGLANTGAFPCSEAMILIAMTNTMLHRLSPGRIAIEVSDAAPNGDSHELLLGSQIVVYSCPYYGKKLARTYRDSWKSLVPENDPLAIELPEG